MSDFAPRLKQPAWRPPVAHNMLDVARGRTNAFMDTEMLPQQAFSPETMAVIPPQNSLTLGDMANFGINAAPFVGDAVAIEDAKKEYQKGNIGTAAFNALTALPLIGDVAAAAKVSIPAMASLGGLYGMMRSGSKHLPDATGAIGRQRGIIGGVNAKTANLEALEQAKEMVGTGIPREQIWQDTGWFKGVDDKWRFEIDDSAAKLNFDKFTKFDPETAIGGYTDIDAQTMSDVFKHDDLYSNYPEAGDIRASLTVSDVAEPQNLGGVYMPSRNSIEAVGVNQPRVRSTSLHELQHNVQEGENFARGGNADQFYPELGETKRNADINIKVFNDAMHEKVKAMDSLEQYRYTKANKGGAIDAEISKLKDEYSILMDKKLSNVPNAQIDVREEAWKKYKALAGEAEARAVQSRMNLTPDERAARPFWEDYDVPESEQIIRFE